MFHNLIESGSHRRDLARRGRFFLGTLASYALVAAAAGITGVYAYGAHLDGQDYQITMLPPWAPPQRVAPPAERDRAQPPRSAAAPAEVPQRTRAYTDLNTVPADPPPVSTARNDVPPVWPGESFILSDRNVDPHGRGAGPVGPGDNGARVAVNPQPHVIETEDVPPPEPPPTPAPTPRKVLVLSQLIGSRIVDKPVPVYPPIAKAAGIQGSVSVEILVDEQGRVVSAKATTGHALLRVAAQQAAMRASFTPTKLNGEPVKVSGVINYNFMLR
jgi:protein TonB